MKKEFSSLSIPILYPATIGAPGAGVDAPAQQEVVAGGGQQRPLQLHAGGPPLRVPRGPTKTRANVGSVLQE